MAPEIRFNSFGIPYLVEFANITFRARSHKAKHSPRPRSGSVTPTSSISKPLLETRPSFESSATISSRPSVDTYSSSRPILNLHPSVHRNRASSRLSFESDWTFATASSETLTGPRMATGKAQHKRDPKLAPVPTPPFSPVSTSPISPILATEPRIVLESEIDTHGRIDSGYFGPGSAYGPLAEAIASANKNANASGEPEGKGLLIRFASQRAPPAHGLSQNRLARLKYRIAKAVMAAGMHAASSPEFAPAEEGTDGCGTTPPRESYMSIGSIYSDEVEECGLPGSLFRGTYGQVMHALQGAGLTASPCRESGVQYATNLGALFVAHQNAYGDVEFTKLTLWA